MACKLFPILSCGDPECSLAFYRDFLGGVETYRFAEKGEPAFIVRSIGGSSEIGLAYEVKVTRADGSHDEVEKFLTGEQQREPDRSAPPAPGWWLSAAASRERLSRVAARSGCSRSH